MDSCEDFSCLKFLVLVYQRLVRSGFSISETLNNSMNVVQPHEKGLKLSYIPFPYELERYSTFVLEATVMEISCQISLSSSFCFSTSWPGVKPSAVSSCVFPLLEARETGEAGVRLWHVGEKQKKNRGQMMLSIDSRPESLCFLSWLLCCR